MHIEKKFKKILLNNKGKKLVVYGSGLHGMNAIYMIKKWGGNIDYILDSNIEKPGKYCEFYGDKIEICSPFDLIHENKKEIIVFITFTNYKEAVDVLKEIGIEEKNIYHIFGVERFEEFSYLDPLLSYSRGDRDFICMSKNPNVEEKYVVLILGNSTTDYSFWGIKSWSEFLQEKCGLDIRIYNGGVAGYSTCQELFKLIRDGITEYNPNIVISYSGVNDAMQASKLYTLDRFSKGIMKTLVDNYRDTTSKECEIYYGKEDDLVNRYINNIRMMKCICEEFECKFYSILQPIMADSILEEIDKEYLQLEPVKRYVKQIQEFNKKVLEVIDKYYYLYDYTSIFKNEKECFVDYLHCTEKGNEMIADNIYKLLNEKEFT